MGLFFDRLLPPGNQTPLQNASTYGMTYHCEQGTIKVEFSSSDMREPNNLRGLTRIDFAALHRITARVRIELIPGGLDQKKLAITLPAAEAVELFGGTEPSTRTYGIIYRRICERKNYPLPEPEIPGGGKSLTAQGQTKKPGSHSHDKHH